MATRKGHLSATLIEAIVKTPNRINVKVYLGKDLSLKILKIGNP